MTRKLAWRLKNISTYVGVIGYLAMIWTGSVAVGAASKLIAEALRVSFYRQTDAKDMERLSYFFIVASTIAIIVS